MKMGDPVAEVAAPAATYRLQLNGGFTFDDAVRVVPYLARLGVSHVYCSPLLRARKGSTHGYDVVDHSALNPELGGAEGFERLVAALRAHGMGLIADVVPNHMGVFGDDNAWWMDVLQNGEASAYAGYFDIEWRPGNTELRGKLLAPVLGEHYADALAQGKLQIEQEPEGGVALRYGPHRFPIHPDDHAQARLVRTPEELHALLERQRFRLAYWRVAADEINYRRFFDVIDLAALRTEDEAVFEATHDYMLKLAAAGKVDGLRIDHPDGLHDPAQYFERLQAGYARRKPGAPPLYVVVEKIAAHHEELPENWQVHGSTGYRFATLVNGLFVDDAARARLERAWRGFTGDHATFDDAARQGRYRILRSSFASELTMLATGLVRLARADPRTRDYTFNALRDALGEVAAAMPVYRTYIAGKPSEQDQRYVDWAVAHAARASSRDADASLYGFVRDALLGLGGRGLRFAMRFQQFSAAIAAKGVEDTAFYFHTPLASLNEVGGNPGRFGVTLRAFHGASADRAAHWPLTLLATSTHDNKRSEDVRQRINVLSEQPGRWRLALRRWHALNRFALGRVDGAQAPSRGDEYLLYQTLLGTFPTEQLDAEGLAAYRERIEQYLLKAAREAKRQTSWFAPNEEYEKALNSFVQALLSRLSPNPFLDDLKTQAAAAAWFGALNSLSMVLIKYSSPGVPDLYQGNELTDLSLVDPDNRRPVDYGLRELLLDSFEKGFDKDLLQNLPDGKAKLWTTRKLLQLRKAHPDLFRRGGYTPLTVRGHAASHVVAYMRSYGDQQLVVIAGRLFAKLGAETGKLPLGELWQDTRVQLPGNYRLTNILSGEEMHPTSRALPLAHAFASFPGAALVTSPAP